MANTPPNGSNANKDDAQSAGSAPQSAGPPPPENAGEGAKSLQEIVAALQAEVGELKDKWLRAHAEVDNIRKRA